ncbi:hypothetical protein F5887DRAFT_923125 [Amanita rubescens]|nr:hypothetical protein F5887DRAFT_923125 [Amanita rubescens]
MDLPFAQRPSPPLRTCRPSPPGHSLNKTSKVTRNCVNAERCRRPLLTSYHMNHDGLGSCSGFTPAAATTRKHKLTPTMSLGPSSADDKCMRLVLDGTDILVASGGPRSGLRMTPQNSQEGHRIPYHPLFGYDRGQVQREDMGVNSRRSTKVRKNSRCEDRRKEPEEQQEKKSINLRLVLRVILASIPQDSSLLYFYTQVTLS